MSFVPRYSANNIEGITIKKQTAIVTRFTIEALKIFPSDDGRGSW
jgi:hypothetical protein